MSAETATEAPEATKPKFSLSPFGVKGMLIDAILAGGVFLFFARVVIPPHVPVYDPLWNTALAGYTATVMGGFSFLFFVLFRVTLVDQLKSATLREGALKTAAKILAYKE